MKREHSSVESFAESSSKRRRLLRQEELILEATELLSSALENRSVTKAELAARLEKSKGFVSQILSGGRNLTLRTLADVADALECRVRLTLEPAENAVNVVYSSNSTGVR